MNNQTIHVWGYAEGCPACDRLKSLLDILNVPYEFHAIEPDCLFREALRKEGFKTVPQVFTQDGTHLGDFTSYRRAAHLGILSAGLGG